METINILRRNHRFTIKVSKSTELGLPLKRDRMCTLRSDSSVK